MCLSLQTGNWRLKVLESYNWKFVVERWLNAMQYQTKEGDCSVDCASQGSFAEEDSCDCGGMSTPGHGQGEGPNGDKWSIDHAGYVGRGRSERSERSPPQSQLSSRCNIK